MRDEICLSTEEMVRAAETEATGLPLENRYGQMPAGLIRKQTLQFLTKDVRDFVLEERRHV